MKIFALALAAMVISMCLVSPVLRTTTAASFPSVRNFRSDRTDLPSVPSRPRADDQGPVKTDINDSDEFLKSAMQPGTRQNYSKRIDDLIKRMTLEEKVGQMTQLAIGMVTNIQDKDVRIDRAKLEKAIVKYGVGSILNV
ncbi:MAG TPA: hypothetical protein VKB46_21135, partial [Pyrinomonadaceae bacterium]|nr:hypothetical protein [Pyrinomonadaceae bacterium]